MSGALNPLNGVQVRATGEDQGYRKGPCRIDGVYSAVDIDGDGDLDFFHRAELYINEVR